MAKTDLSIGYNNAESSFHTFMTLSKIQLEEQEYGRVGRKMLIYLFYTNKVIFLIFKVPLNLYLYVCLFVCCVFVCWSLGRKVPQNQGCLGSQYRSHKSPIMASLAAFLLCSLEFSCHGESPAILLKKPPRNALGLCTWERSSCSDTLGQWFSTCGPWPLIR